MGKIKKENKCKICNHEIEFVFRAKVLNKYDVSYYKCTNCGLLQTEEPYWLTDAYNSAITLSDTGLVYRNIRYSKIITPLLFYLFDKYGKYVDYGGGYGLFTRLMRDIGYDFYWYDIFAENIFARGFNYTNKIKPIEAITAFEVFEHLDNILISFEKMLSISKSIIFSTALLPIPVPDPRHWHYYAFEHGQHISFYEGKTLLYLAQKYKLNYISNGIDLHIITDKVINKNKFMLLLRLAKYGLSHFCQKKLNSRFKKDSELIKKTIVT